VDTVRPEDYARWRATRLGGLTEGIERDLVLDLAGPLTGLRVLDVGCGDGTFAVAAAIRGASVTAVDRSEPMLGAARRRAADAGVEVCFKQADVRRLPFDDGAFDVVLAVAVLCFVEDAAGAVAEMGRVLAPGGRLVLGDLNPWSTWAASRRIRGWLGDRTWGQARFRSGPDLARLAAGAALDVQFVRGAVFYPPIGGLAAVLWPLDRRLGTVTTFGGAFVAMVALKRGANADRARGGQAEVVARNVVRALTGSGDAARYDGHGACFVESGGGRAGCGAGNFYAKPRPAVRMYRPGRTWHAGKVLFEKYWFWRWL
jgi:SAM-dependent methyltransferase